MGLSVSESKAEREREEQVAVKKIKSTANSDSKSAGKIQAVELKNQYQIRPQGRSSNILKYTKMDNNTNDEENKKNYLPTSCIPNNNINGENSVIPKIEVIPPSQKKELLYQKDKSEQLQRNQYFQTIDQYNQNNQHFLQPIKKNPQFAPIHSELKKSINFPEEKNKRTFLKQIPKQVPQRQRPESILANNSQQMLDDSMAKNGSRTQMVKVGQFPLKNQAVVNENNPSPTILDVELNFDWEIPRPSNENDLTANKKLKHEASVVLINKLGKQDEQHKRQQNRSKTNWKNRRQLMNQIVNDRLQTADNGLPFTLCMPKSEQKSIQYSGQICS